jgi:hypothetical protein
LFNLEDDPLPFDELQSHAMLFGPVSQRHSRNELGPLADLRLEGMLLEHSEIQIVSAESIRQTEYSAGA